MVRAYAVQYRGRGRGRGRRGGRGTYRAGVRPRAYTVPRPGYMRIGGTIGRFFGGTELKYLRTGDAVLINSGAPHIVESLNLVPSGNGPSDRVGSKITIRYIHVYGAVTTAVSVPSSFITYRVVIYVDKQCNGEAAEVTDILDGVLTSSHVLIENSHRFRILYDKRVNMVSPSYDTDLMQHSITGKVWEFSKVCKIDVMFQGVAASGSIDQVRSNNIGILLGTAGATIQTVVARIRYSDK